MNKILRYNTFILNFIIVVFLLILIAMGYKMWQTHVWKEIKI